MAEIGSVTPILRMFDEPKACRDLSDSLNTL